MNRRVIYGIRIIINTIRVPLMRLISLSKIKCSFMELFSIGAEIRANNAGRVCIGKMCNIEKNSLIRASGGNVVFGSNIYINRNCNVISHKKIEIDEGTTIGPNVCIYDHDHNYNGVQGDSKYNLAAVHIGKNVWIGANCVITKGVIVGNNSVVAAGSVVTKSVPEFTIVGGVPAKEIKKICKAGGRLDI